jgi:hypothetical protein
MSYYRLYHMDLRTGHIIRFEEMEAVGDEEAIARADRCSHSAPMELWCGGRKVHRFEPSSIKSPMNQSF